MKSEHRGTLILLSPMRLPILVVVWSLVVPSLSGSHASAQELGKGLLLYVPFDHTAQPAFCRGKPDVSLGAAFLGKGRVGGGLTVIGSASAKLSALGNFHQPRGTIAFWHKPAWDPNAGSLSHRTLLKQTNFQITWYGPKRTMFFMTGNTEIGVGYKWDYSVATTKPRVWQKGEWHHLAITWDRPSGQKQLFLDGEVASEGKTIWLRDKTVGVAAKIALGSPSAEGAYDEWAIWDRVLSKDEIARLAGDPGASAVTLSAVDSPKEPAKAPVRFELVPFVRPAESIVDPGESCHLAVNAISQTGDSLRLKLHLAIVDGLDRVYREWERTIELGPCETRALKLDVSASATGAFKVRADFEWDGQKLRRDLGGFAVWPANRCRPSPDSFFGNHVNSWFGGAFIAQAKRLGLSWQRGHNMFQATWMTQVQPEPGEPKWIYSDQVDACREAHISVLGEFFAIPYWAADPPAAKPGTKESYPKGSKPQLDAFERYIKMTIRRYGDFIRVWEVWNEPEVSLFWTGTAEEFGHLAHAACRAAKEADPTCTVVVGGFTGAWGRDWYERAAKAGAFSLADGISYHGYARSMEERRAKLEMIRSLAAEYAPKREATELWDSEWGVHDTTFYVDADIDGLPARHLLPSPSYLDGAVRVVKADCVSMGLGVKRSFYYLHNPVKGPASYHNGSAIEITRAPRPKLMARVAMEFLTRDTKVKSLVERPKVSALVLSRNEKQSLAIVWLNEDGQAELSAPWPKAMRLLDLFANPIATAPVIISDVPIYLQADISATAMAALLRKATLEGLRQD